MQRWEFLKFRVTNPFAPLLIWAFVSLNAAFCQLWNLLKGDIGLQPEVLAFSEAWALLHLALNLAAHPRLRWSTLFLL